MTRPTNRSSRRRPIRKPATRGRKARRTRVRRGFVGREGSPVLDSYRRTPPPALPAVAPPASAPGAVPPDPQSPGLPPAPGLLTLDRPFDIDGFSQLLGETSIRIEVPKEDLPEVLRRITDFMGFGIYVYAFSVRPASEESLRRFVVELQRVDFSGTERRWVPFQEKGTSESPFGPSSGP